jgi:TolB protein
MKKIVLALIVSSAVACDRQSDHAADSAAAAADAGRRAREVAPLPGEVRLANIRQLTFGGENAEAYFSPDGEHLIFQSTRDGYACDQQYIMRTDGSELQRVSTGTGRTTCGYFHEGGSRILFSSTHAFDAACPARPDYSKGYVWPLSNYEIYTANVDGSDLRALTNFGSYTTEATLSPDGSTIVFTSLKDGDLDIYTMKTDGSDVRRLTNTPGYDGGAFFSPDGSRIVYRAHHPTDPEELQAYRDLLEERLVRPSRMELWIMNADGSDQRQVTTLGGANFAPFFTPDGTQIIFSSNHANPSGRVFDLFLVNLDGGGLERVTTYEDFDGFPMFSPDGSKLVWASNRNGQVPGETNIFIADWLPRAP